MKKYYSIENDKLIETNNINKFILLEVKDPSEHEIEELIEKYNIPSDYLYDVNDPDEVSRVEGTLQDEHSLFILSYPVKIDTSKYITRVVQLF